jgi:hypothetical protein
MPRRFGDQDAKLRTCTWHVSKTWGIHSMQVKNPGAEVLRQLYSEANCHTGRHFIFLTFLNYLFGGTTTSFLTIPIWRSLQEFRGEIGVSTWQPRHCEFSNWCHWSYAALYATWRGLHPINSWSTRRTSNDFRLFLKEGLPENGEVHPMLIFSSDENHNPSRAGEYSIFVYFQTNLIVFWYKEYQGKGAARRRLLDHLSFLDDLALA